jgi:hypothetical protein
MGSVAQVIRVPVIQAQQPEFIFQFHQKKNDMTENTQNETKYLQSWIHKGLIFKTLKNSNFSNGKIQKNLIFYRK